MGFYSLPTGKGHRKKTTTKRVHWKISLLILLVVFKGIEPTTLIILQGLDFYGGIANDSNIRSNK